MSYNSPYHNSNYENQYQPADGRDQLSSMEPRRQLDDAYAGPNSQGYQPYEPPPYQGYVASGNPPSPPRHNQIPSPPQHRSPPRLAQTRPNYNGQQLQDPQRNQSFTTPGGNNLSQRALGGGTSGIAMGVAGSNEREVRVSGLREIDNWGRPAGAEASGPGLSNPAERYQDVEMMSPYGPSRSHSRMPSYHHQNSFSSIAPLAATATAPGHASLSSNHFDHNSSGELTPNGYSNGSYGLYSETPYDRHSSSRTQLGMIDPRHIADDGDDGIYHPEQRRRSMLGVPLGGSRSTSRNETSTPTGAVGAAAAAAGTAGAGLLSNVGSRNAGPKYGPVSAASGADEIAEKTEWLKKQEHRKKRKRWIIIAIVAFIVAAAIAGGVAGGILAVAGSGSSDDEDSGRQGISAEEDDGNGDLSLESNEIKDLMNNKGLHKVFPGIDYTPNNSQYPECLTDPPSQNNVTRDMAVLSQLTNTLRLYGNDCNQTEMVIHAIRRLELDDMKVWLGVWLGSNETTNSRQLERMETILDEYGEEPFIGVVVGNEVLFREDLTSAELREILDDVKDTLDEKGIDLPLATSDLSDGWDVQLAQTVDVIMANIHPFFTGITGDKAASWTWTFWQQNSIPLTQGQTGKEHIVSEVGWPSEGGNNCGPEKECKDDKEGSVANIEGINTLMEDWVCESLKNGTNYFWFEAFDEPWKVRFNEPEEDKEWEDKWGLMDVNRVLKPGVKIPDCGGTEVSRRRK